MLSARLATRKVGAPVRYPRIRARRGLRRFTHLAACVSEEDGCFTVQVRLSDEAEPAARAWGEEIADSFEEASAMLGDLAAAYAIPQAHIEIILQLANSRDGTRH